MTPKEFDDLPKEERDRIEDFYVLTCDFPVVIPTHKNGGEYSPEFVDYLKGQKKIDELTFEELKERAQPYSDLAFERPLTDTEYRDFKAIMDRIIKMCGGFENDKISKEL